MKIRHSTAIVSQDLLVSVEVTGPKTELEAAWWAAREFFYDVIVPAALVAGSVTAFVWGLR